MPHKLINAVGVCFFCSTTHRYLYLLRSDPRSPETWGLAGGRVEHGESLLQAIERECREEIGEMPAYQRLVPIEKFTSADNRFAYHTFYCSVEHEFVPVLNDEHHGYAWISSGHWPRPLHPGLWNTVNIESVQQKLTLLENSSVDSSNSTINS